MRTGRHTDITCGPRTVTSQPSTALASRRPEELLGDRLSQFYSMALKAGLVYDAKAV